MKKIILAIALVFLTFTAVQAADVVITITIPDEYVSRVETAVSNLNCNVVDENGEVINTLGPIQCLKRKMLNELGDFVNKCEEKTAKESAMDAYSGVYQDWLDNYVPIPVN